MQKTGVASASFIIIALVGTAVGALLGLFLEGIIINQTHLGVIVGFLATIIALLVRYKLVFRLAGAGPDSSKVPWIVLISAAVASLIGGLAGHDLAEMAGTPTAVFIGTMSGLLSAVLTGLLLVTYHATPPA
jgi:hypothetical protein